MRTDRVGSEMKYLLQTENKEYILSLVVPTSRPLIVVILGNWG
jgi:hypothetical protein